MFCESYLLLYLIKIKKNGKIVLKIFFRIYYKKIYLIFTKFLILSFSLDSFIMDSF